MTATQLLSLVRGTFRPGAYRCFYCGCECDDSFLATTYVASSFTERDCVAAPGSPYVCAGCVEAMRSDLAEVPLIDGTVYRTKEGGKRQPKPGQAGVIQSRWFSWVITHDKVLGATPAHRELLRQICLDPPEPPFAICIADGNKHQLFRTPVTKARSMVLLNCEGTRVTYHPEQLHERLALTMKLVACCGKGSNSITRLLDPMSDVSVALQLGRMYEDAGETYEGWRQVRNQPLTELALWLCPGGDDARASLGITAAD